MARWEPPAEQVVESPKPRRWPGVVLLLLAILGVAAGGIWVLRRQLRPPNRSRMMMATDVRSAITVAGDSLDVVVSWALADTAAGLPDSVRVEVGLGDGQESVAKMTPSHRQSDTLRVRAPAPGETASGYSCAAPVRGARLARERCTPWQYVRPSARAAGVSGDSGSASTGSKRSGARPPAVLRIVIEPAGQQVDPDVAGRCAAWQQRNPGRAVWIEVNQEAVPECMGPNGKPVVAKFCAFAVLVNGRRIKTENSSNDAYCERLYQAWVRERVA